MKKIKHELDSWDEGRDFMDKIAKEFGITIEDTGQNLILSHDKFQISCHFDEREFSYILMKLTDESLENQIISILSQFKSNQA